MKTICHRSIHEIDADLWNSIIPENEPFHSHKFISVNEDAGVENSKFWYLLFYVNDKLVATTVLSAFVISLDLFIGNIGIVRFIKKTAPDFFRTKILVCGLPVSLGQRNLVIISDNYTEEVLFELSKKMDEICIQENIKNQTIKEFREKYSGKMDHACDNGFFKAFSIPYMNMDIRWNKFDEYLSDMRHTFKRQIRNSLRKIGKTVPVVKKISDEQLSNIFDSEIILVSQKMCPPGFFYSLYMKVMERATTKLETLNDLFFKFYYGNMNDEMKMLALVNNGKIISAAILHERGEELTFVLVGRENEKDHFDSYYNLIYGIIEYAIKNKFKLLNLGQTSYWVKQRIGGRPENVFLYFKSRNRFIHFVLRKLNKIIFPEMKLPVVKIFKEK